MTNDKEARSIVNSSGFPFQLAVAKAIETTKEQHGWFLLSQEHAWRDRESGEDGFIDIIAGKDNRRLVIECKRVGGGAWVFLVPSGTSTENDTQVRYIKRQAPTHSIQLGTPIEEWISDWSDEYINPPSYISEFCAVYGMGRNDRPMLERVADDLINSVEALGDEEITATYFEGPGKSFVYIPMIVTNSPLFVCKFDPQSVPLATGQLPEDVGEFEKTGWIRFRKSLTTKMTDRRRAKSIEETHNDRTRIVIVVNAEALSDFLYFLSFSEMRAERAARRD